jgi:hypothetical protein
MKAGFYWLCAFTLPLAILAGCPGSDPQPAGSGGTSSSGTSSGGISSGGTAGSDAAVDAPPDSITPDAPDDGCVKKSCQDLGAQCGSVDDGCNGTLDCGNCDAPKICGTRNECCPRVVGVFDATPSGGCGVACNVANASLSDGVFAGLDCAGGGTPPEIDGYPVSSCVAADFGGAFMLDPVIVRARATSNACGTACSGGDCGTGHEMIVFRGVAAGAYTFVTEVQNLGATATDYAVSLNAAAQYVVVCRWAYSPYRDDIEVDAISTGGCQ